VSLADKGLVVDGTVTEEAVALRQRIEDDTDRQCIFMWQRLGRDASIAFAEQLEPPCVQLLARVDQTAGPNYQPASRIRPPR
jgi:hypothetical protein